MISNSTLLSPVMPFPSLQWWLYVIHADAIVFDIGEHFQKMSLRNRYHIGAANGILGLSIPLEKGRDQKERMGAIKISYIEDWQKKHWRSLESAYRRSPFFEFIGYKFQDLYQEKIDHLWEWNKRSIDICTDILQLKLKCTFSEKYIEHEGEYTDLRQQPTSNLTDWKSYIQPFAHRLPFLSNLSIIDALCCIGPQETLAYLAAHQPTSIQQ